MPRSAARLACTCALLRPLLPGAVRLKRGADEPPDPSLGRLAEDPAGLEGRLAVLSLGRLVDDPSALSLDRLRGAGLEGKGFDCAAAPDLCQPPFDCQLPTDMKPMVRNGLGMMAPVMATADGHADWRQFCMWSDIAKQARQCYQGDLRGYSRTLGERQSSLPGSLKLQARDAHYCFASGHCDNMELRSNTTLAQAEAMCDRQFGHRVWTTFTSPAINPFLDLRLSQAGLHLNAHGELELAKMACAMGMFHCDAFFCQEHFCANPEWRYLFDNERPTELRDAHGSNYPPEH